MANSRLNKKFIKLLVSKEGVILDNIENIMEEMMHLFGKLYSKPLGGFWRLEGLDLSPFSTESVAWLNCPFLEEEIHKVLFQLNKEKAPRPNGFTITVY